MTKFATKQKITATAGPLRTVDPSVTYEGGLGFGRDAKSELFTLGISNLVGENTFYEDAASRDSRFADLVRVVTEEDPSWVRQFAVWLREDMHLRSVPIVTAAEYVAAGGEHGRSLAAAVCQRPDEPAELLAYWFQTRGRKIPAPLKRGLADAVTRLYSERAALKYDGKGKAWRMGDVIELVHPKPSTSKQSQLFKYLIETGKDREMIAIGDDLEMLRLRAALDALPVEARRVTLRDSDALAMAGMTWEALPAWLGGAMDAAAWEAIIPSMGYMALLRNLRNFEEAGVSAATLSQVAAKLADPEEVARSKQFPIRFLSAWLANPTMTFGPALERALELSVQNIPSLPGRSLILVDCSGSMWGTNYSERSQTKPYQTAGIFGLALAKRAASAEIFAYGTKSVPLVVGPQASILRTMESLPDLGGTRTWQTVTERYSGHDRVIILTDEQAFYAHPSYDNLPDIPKVFTFNLQGYKVAHAEERPGWHTFGGGLTDAAFRLLAVLDRGRDAGWPWESS